ncbi:hypothetical protein B0H14DRAFT_2614873 [Mycena olivaceomarginata]|nr:hypothetical protein B0H14DRAFT_2614873 [Mycena olivaceomarginata]
MTKHARNRAGAVAKLVLLRSGLVDSVKQSPNSNSYSKFLGPNSAPVHSDLHHCVVRMPQTGLPTLTDDSPRCPAHGCSADCGETSNSMRNYGIYNAGTHSRRALLEATDARWSAVAEWNGSSPSIPPQSQSPNGFRFAARAARIFGLFWGRDKVVNAESDSPFTHILSTQIPAKKRCPALPEVQRRRKSAASARYREHHAEELLPKERERAARRRAHLKTLKEGDDDLERARAQARANSARYRAQNRERLAARARDDRKTAFVAKHGFRAYLDRRLDNL